MNELVTKESGGEFLLYQTEDGRVRLDVRLADETVWLTQQLMADLFQTTKQNISLHIQSIFKEGELAPEATVKKYLTVRWEVKKQEYITAVQTGLDRNYQPMETLFSEIIEKSISASAGEQ